MKKIRNFKIILLNMRITIITLTESKINHPNNFDERDIYNHYFYNISSKKDKKCQKVILICQKYIKNFFILNIFKMLKKIAFI